jgi:hypothetical protein
MLFADFVRRSGAQFIAGLAVMFNAVLPALATDAAKPFNRPLLFEPNHGQAARGPEYQLFFTTDAVTIAVPDRAAAPQRTSLHAPESLLPRLPFSNPVESRMSAFRMKLNGSHAWNAADGLEPTGSISNYYIGNDPK